ncbi:hypothetical protein EV193_103680 [Herbihabitans rhizosphaerae]|uniref:PE family protein n=1 Tax=Herbihabitans rhizosphaerae TaxID=1872711 RepID=A0A4Q7KXB1_9PSEU|nr:hypothetical protein [Herbihabitans rhizosphaerae]RZS41357.1 hypothetical protein EV193_103680 [Herbihabitans rhizosphaerae]
MLIDSGGGGGSTPPPYAGPQRLRVEPSAIPAVREAFRKAQEAVAKETQNLSALDRPYWAGDQISRATAEKIIVRTYGENTSGAHTLAEYAGQLQGVWEALDASYKAYERVEGSNTAMWGKHHKA